MEEITKLQINASIDAYAKAVDIYSNSISSLTVSGKSTARVDFENLIDSIANGEEISLDDIQHKSENEKLSTQMLEMSQVYSKFQSFVEIKGRIGNIYKMSVTGKV